MLGSSDGLLEGAPLVEGDIERFWLTLGDLDGLDVGLPVPVLVGLRLGWLDGIPLTLGLLGGIDVGLLVLVGLILGCELSWETSRRWDSLLSGRTRMVGRARQDSRSEAHWQHGNSTTCRQKGFNPTDSVQEDVHRSGVRAQARVTPRGWPSARRCTSPNSSRQIVMRRGVPRLGWPRGASGLSRRRWRTSPHDAVAVAVRELYGVTVARVVHCCLGNQTAVSLRRNGNQARPSESGDDGKLQLRPRRPSPSVHVHLILFVQSQGECWSEEKRRSMSAGRPRGDS